MKITGIILAAGNGSRMNMNTQKQFLQVQGYPLVYYSLAVFEQHPNIHDIILVTGAENVDYCKKEIIGKHSFQKVKKIAVGGKERYDSVYAGLLACGHTDGVLIHDGARPFVSQELITRCIHTLEEEVACVVGVPSKDTIKMVDENGYISNTPDRTLVWNVQTPQAFHFQLIKESYEKLFRENQQRALQGTGNAIKITDDAMVVETANHVKIKVIMGDYENIKITTQEDLTLSEKIFEKVSKNY